MSTDNKITPTTLKTTFAPASAEECSMEDLAGHGFASEPQPLTQEPRKPHTFSPGSAVGE